MPLPSLLQRLDLQALPEAAVSAPAGAFGKDGGIGWGAAFFLCVFFWCGGGGGGMEECAQCDAHIPRKVFPICMTSPRKIFQCE